MDPLASLDPLAPPVLGMDLLPKYKKFYLSLHFQVLGDFGGRMQEFHKVVRREP